MTTISFEACKLKYSQTEGVFIVTDRGEFAALCQSEQILWEYLETYPTTRDFSDVRILLVGVQYWDDKDDVTHAYFDAKRGSFESYEGWVEEHGYESVFMEFWFDEMTGHEYQQDMDKRYRQWRDSQAPAVLSVASTVRAPMMQAAE